MKTQNIELIDEEEVKETGYSYSFGTMFYLTAFTFGCSFAIATVMA